MIGFRSIRRNENDENPLEVSPKSETIKIGDTSNGFSSFFDDLEFSETSNGFRRFVTCCQFCTFLYFFVLFCRYLEDVDIKKRWFLKGWKT